MTRSDDNRLIMMLMSGMVVIVVAMIVAMFIVTRRPVVLMMPGSEPTSDVSNPPGETASANESGVAQSPDDGFAPPPTIVVQRVSRVPAINDPMDIAWNQIPEIEISLESQSTAAPQLEELTVESMLVQAMRDDERICWRISWDQLKPEDATNVARFSDAVALQFPLVDGAPYTMGGPDLPVMMLYWKALWQRDIDQGFQGVEALYPNSWSDFYWFADGKAFPESFQNDASRQFLIGLEAGNPMSSVNRTKPLQEMSAHGFGTSTGTETTPSNAKGVWNDGKWTVVIDRPLAAGDPLMSRFSANPDQQLIAFAVWDGAAQNRGGRKQITNWIPMRIEP